MPTEQSGEGQAARRRAGETGPGAADRVLVPGAGVGVGAGKEWRSRVGKKSNAGSGMARDSGGEAFRTRGVRWPNGRPGPLQHGPAKA